MEFRKAVIEDRERLIKYFPEDTKASHQSFTNLFIWQTGYNIYFAVEDDILYIKGKYKGIKYFIFPCGNGDLDKAINKIIQMSGDECVFNQLLPNEAEYLEKNYGFEISENRDAWEYLYETEKLKTLSGKKLHAKKNHYNAFVKGYDYRYEPINPDNINRAKAFSLKQLEGLDDREEEKNSINKMFDNFDALKLVGAILFVGEEIAAVTVGEYMNRDTALIHLEKADTRYNGSYAAINKMFIENRFADTKLVNREEDMGIEGLRHAKMSYHPADFVRKYTGVRRNEG